MPFSDIYERYFYYECTIGKENHTLQSSDKLESGGESPLTIRARCGVFRNFPDPLGIVPAEAFVKLELGGWSYRLVILSEQSESKDLRTDFTAKMIFVRRFLDYARNDRLDGALPQ